MSHSDLDNEANGKMNGDQVCPRRIAMELNNLGVAMLQQVNQDEAANDMLRLALKACLESSPSRSSSEGHNIKPSDAKDVCKIDSTFGNYLAMIQQGKKKLEASVAGACTTCLSRVENRHVRVQNTFLLLDPIRIEYSGNDVDEGLAVAITMHNISVLFCRQGSWDRAMQMIETALDLVASIEECDAYPYVGSLVFPILLNNLGHLMTRTGCDRDKDGAGGMLSEALRVAQDAVLVTRRYCQDGEELLPATLCHFISTIFYNNGRLHYMEGEHEEAVECFSEALSYSSPSNPSLLISILFNMNSIGRCYLKEGKSNHAAKIFHQALTVETRISNTSNSTLPAEVYASIYFNLGYICCRSGLQLEAMQYFSTSLRLTTNAFGSTHAHVVGLQDRINHFWRSFLQQSDVNSAAQAA